MAADRRADEARGVVITAGRGDDVAGKPSDLNLAPLIAANNAAHRIGSRAADLAVFHVGVDDVGVFDRAGNAAHIRGIPVNMVSGTGIGVHGRIQDGRVGSAARYAAHRGIAVTEAVWRCGIRPYGYFVRNTVLNDASPVIVSGIGAVRVPYQAAYIPIGALHIPADYAFLDSGTHCLAGQDARIVRGSGNIVVIGLETQARHAGACPQLREKSYMGLIGHAVHDVRGDTDRRIGLKTEILNHHVLFTCQMA